MTDGGVAEPIPITEAIRLGGDTKLMVVRARHKHYMKKDTLFHKSMKRKMNRYPQIFETLSRREMIIKTLLINCTIFQQLESGASEYLIEAK